jgi:hypothetical protein
MNPPDEPGTPGESLLDRHLRDLLAPPPGQAERIARRALTAAGAEDGRRSLPRWRPLVPAASLLALLAAAAVFFAVRLERPRQDAVVSIVNIDGMVIATSEEEERPLVLSGAGEPQSSGIILVRHGDPE